MVVCNNDGGGSGSGGGVGSADSNGGVGNGNGVDFWWCLRSPIASITALPRSTKMHS